MGEREGVSTMLGWTDNGETGPGNERAGGRGSVGDHEGLRDRGRTVWGDRGEQN
jgi:hypothetical protein